MTFCLSSGGHNVGVVNPPGPGVKRSFQLATRKVADPYVAPAVWSAAAPSHNGSWWPAWERWLRAYAGKRGETPTLGSELHPPLEDAPGTYVLIP